MGWGRGSGCTVGAGVNQGCRIRIFDGRRMMGSWGATCRLCWWWSRLVTGRCNCGSYRWICILWSGRVNAGGSTSWSKALSLKGREGCCADEGFPICSVETSHEGVGWIEQVAVVWTRVIIHWNIYWSTACFWSLPTWSSPILLKLLLIICTFRCKIHPWQLSDPPPSAAVTNSLLSHIFSPPSLLNTPFSFAIPSSKSHQSPNEELWWTSTTRTGL